MAKQRILILGSAGNLGREFVELYKDQKPLTPHRYDLDITDEQEVMTQITKQKPTLVINCAAYNDVDAAEDAGRIQAELINGYAVGYLANACREVGATLVHFSTGQVFDGKQSEGYKEDDLANPVNAYGRSKLLGELELQKRNENFYIIRTAWLFGKGSKSKESKKSFVDIMLEMGKKEENINVITDGFGSPTYVLDLAQAVKALIEDKKPFGIYHLTNSGVASRFEWAKEIFALKNIDAKLTQVDSNFYRTKRKALRPKYEVLKNTKFIELRPWTEALKEFLISN